MIKRVIEIVGTQRALAKKIGVTDQAVYFWVQNDRVPAKRCRDVSNATGGAVTVHDLRPDIFGPAPDQ